MQFVRAMNAGAVLCYKMEWKLCFVAENGNRTIFWDRKWSKDYFLRQKIEWRLFF